jgi:hypothetical protein
MNRTSPALVLLFVCALSAAALADWPVVYQTDFSTDPNWIDDDGEYRLHFPSELPLGDDHLWQEAEGQYFIRWRNWIGDPPAPYAHPNRYAYTPVPWTRESFRLTWDQEMVVSEFSSASPFGLFDEDMQTGGQGNLIGVDFHIDVTTHLRAITLGVHAGGHVYGDVAWAAYEDGQWYTCTLLYDSVGQTASLDVVERATGDPVASLEVSILTGFSKPLTRLGASRSGTGEIGYIEESPHAFAEAYIDNLRLEMVPEPSVLALIALGVAVLVAARKA